MSLLEEFLTRTGYRYSSLMSVQEELDYKLGITNVTIFALHRQQNVEFDSVRELYSDKLVNLTLRP